MRHFLEVLDEFNHLGVTFISLRENIDRAGPLGRAMVVIVGAIMELERSLIVERVRAGMRRAELEGRRIGRAPLEYRPAAGCFRSSRGIVPNQSCEQTPHFSGVCMPFGQRGQRSEEKHPVASY